MYIKYNPPSANAFVHQNLFMHCGGLLQMKGEEGEEFSSILSSILNISILLLVSAFYCYTTVIGVVTAVTSAIPSVATGSSFYTF